MIRKVILLASSSLRRDDPPVEFGMSDTPGSLRLGFRKIFLSVGKIETFARFDCSFETSHFWLRTELIPTIDSSLTIVN